MSPAPVHVPLRVIALGQALAGDDGVALAALTKLRTHLGNDCKSAELLVVREPSKLVELLCHPGTVWLIDAVIGSAAPGTVLELSPEQLLASASCSLSSHGLNAAQAIDLCGTLYPEEMSRDVRILAVAIDPPRRYGSGLSPQVEAAAVRCAERLLGEVEAATHDP